MYWRRKCVEGNERCKREKVRQLEGIASWTRKYVKEEKGCGLVSEIVRDCFETYGFPGVYRESVTYSRYVDLR